MDISYYFRLLVRSVITVLLWRGVISAVCLRLRHMNILGGTWSYRRFLPENDLLQFPKMFKVLIKDQKYDYRE